MIAPTIEPAYFLKNSRIYLRGYKFGEYIPKKMIRGCQAENIFINSWHILDSYINIEWVF